MHPCGSVAWSAGPVAFPAPPMGGPPAVMNQLSNGFVEPVVERCVWRFCHFLWLMVLYLNFHCAVLVPLCRFGSI